MNRYSGDWKSTEDLQERQYGKRFFAQTFTAGIAVGALYRDRRHRRIRHC